MCKFQGRYKKISLDALWITVTDDKFVLVFLIADYKRSPTKQISTRDHLKDGNYIVVASPDGRPALRNATQEWHLGELKRKGEREL